MKPKKNKSEALVYSTDFGRACPGCGKPVGKCCCGKSGSAISNDGIVRILAGKKRDEKGLELL